MKYKTPTGRRKKSLLDVVYGKEFVDELRSQSEATKREETKKKVKGNYKKMPYFELGINRR